MIRIATLAVGLLVLPHPSFAITLGNVDMGDLADYHMLFTNGVDKAKWQGASKGYIGDVAVNGDIATEETSGSFGYSGTIVTNAADVGAWSDIVDNNTSPDVPVTTAFTSFDQDATITGLISDFDNILSTVTSLTATV